MNRRKRLGQYLLVSREVLDTIMATAQIQSNETVFEVGTGHGILTEQLCKRAKKVISCEVDANLLDGNKALIDRYDNLTLIVADGFDLDLDFDLFVSNLPYSESRRAIEWLACRDFDRAVMMVQKEFASKLLSSEGSNYRAVSALAQYCFHIEPVANVPRDSFEPEPRVDSVLLKITRKEKPVNRNLVSALKLLFSYRGKKVSSVARKFNIREFDSEKRVEDLAPKEAVRFARMMILNGKRLLRPV